MLFVDKKKNTRLPLLAPDKAGAGETGNNGFAGMVKIALAP